MRRPKRSVFIAWRIIGPESSIHMIFFVEGQEYVALGSLEVSSYIWWRIKIIFTIIEWLGNMGHCILYPLILKWKCLDKSCKGFPILYRGAIINPVSNPPKDTIYINLTSSKEDGMVYHDQHNLVLNILEEECG